MSDENRTKLVTDIVSLLKSSEQEASNKLACFVVVGGPLSGTVYDLPEGEITIGRNIKNEIVIETKGISREHCRITTAGDNVIVTDLNSSNGTFLNDTPIKRDSVLRKGDVVKLGGTATLKFIPKGDPERLAYDQLSIQANTDGLTGCYNKAYFNKSIEVEVKKAIVTGDSLCLLIIDLDHFKNINDNYGHDAGDYVLKNTAELIADSGIRKGDVFARYGGEEFVILLPNTVMTQGYDVAQRIRKMVEQNTFVYDNKKIKVTCSIGLAQYRKQKETMTDFFKRADKAVYDSKEKGRNQVNFSK